MSQKDIPGYAMISGGPDNGKYIDNSGKLYRLASGSLYEVESGDLAAVQGPSKPAGQVIGSQDGDANLSHPDIANRTRYSSAGVDEVLLESVKEDAMPTIADVVDKAKSTTVEVKAKKGKTKPAAVEPDVVATDLIADYSPAEILSMTRSLVANLDKAGVKHDIEPLEGNDETSVRANAEAIAKYAEA